MSVTKHRNPNTPQDGIAQLKRLRSYALLSLAAIVVGSLVSAPTSAQIGAQRPLIIWSRTVKRPVSMAVSPDSRFAAVIDRAGTLAYYSSVGKPLWTQDAGDATCVAIAGNGGLLVTYTPLNPLRRRVSILTANGKARWSRMVYGSVWSAAVSRDGSTAVVGTGARRVYIFKLGRRLSYHRRTLPGIPCSLSFTPDDKSLVVGMWQDSGVGVFDLNGKPRWWSKGFMDLQYTARMSRRGGFILGHGQPNRPQPRDVLALWKSDGTKLWQNRLGFDDVQAEISNTGSVVGVSYRQRITHGSQEMSQQRLVMFDRKGAKVWSRDKGGMFLKYRLMMMLPGDGVMVSSENALYILDRQGRTLWKQKLPGLVKQFVAAPDAGRTLLYCGDGRLYMFGQGS
jgi:WD40 repeat protein